MLVDIIPRMIRVGNCNAGYLTGSFERWAVSTTRAYRDGVLRYVLPSFASIEKDAQRLADEFYHSLPGYDECDPAAGAEMAQERGIEFYQMMDSVRQTMLNLVTAGLFHHVEQQLIHISRDRLFVYETPPAKPHLYNARDWYETQFGLDLSTLPSWDAIDELRRLANTVKHAEIDQTKELHTKRPRLFDPPFYDDPRYESLAEGKAERDKFPRRAVSQPLAGDDVFVRRDDFERYADAAESFFLEIADFFRNYNH